MASYTDNLIFLVEYCKHQVLPSLPTLPKAISSHQSSYLLTCGYSEELAACSSSVKALLCWSLMVLNSSLTARGERRFIAAKRWPIAIKRDKNSNSNYLKKTSHECVQRACGGLYNIFFDNTFLYIFTVISNATS